MTRAPRCRWSLVIAASLCAGAVAGARAAEPAAFAHGPRTRPFVARPIRGVCGSQRLADAVARGADCVRTYSAPTVAELDRYHALGLRVIVGHWMPNEGENPGKDGWPWKHSYAKSAAAMDREFTAIVERIGDHPAVVMWSLGNEVRLEPEYLRQANRLSRIVHARHPDVPTSLTMVNAPAASLQLVRKHAPDIDVVGANVYGAGAVTNAANALREHWGRAFYFSEFGCTGPWWGPQTSWGERFEPGATAKAADLVTAWERIAAADGCLGGCAFMWGRWTQERISYFSMLLPADPWSKSPADADLRFTPLADAMATAWKRPPARRAPRLDRVEIGGQSGRDVVVEPRMRLEVAAVVNKNDRDSALRYRWWIARQTKGGFRPVAGPVDAATPDAEIAAPAERGGRFFLFGLVLDDAGGACATTLPFKIAD